MRSRILQIRGGLIGPYSLAEFRRCGFADVIFGPAIRLAIRVKRPETEHTVSVGKLRSWLEGGGKNPNEQMMKSRLRETL